MRAFLFFLLVTSALAAGDGSAESGPAELRFNRDVRPLLSNHCFECHGPDEAQRKADLRLDLEAGLALVVVPGDPGASALAQRVTHADPDQRMPPAEFRNELDDQDRELLLRWISEGARFEPHWAYQPPERSALPDGDGDAVDLLLDQGLREAQLTPAPRADRRTQVRRLYQDLLGLPPSPEQVAEFVADEGPGAWSRLVERVLASPHHAERLTQHWLDLVRYADTVGYHGDQRWTVWPYRDWVLRAFAENMPFDRFTIEQVAGDLLPDATLDQRVAATFCRLNMVTFEGGSQDKEFLAKYAADRVRTTGSVWLGSTLGCAECHDHKFDPFSTRDFYRFAAYFADITEVGVFQRFQDGEVPPQLAVPSEDQAERRQALEAEQAWRRRALEGRALELEPQRLAWERELRRQLANGTRSDAAWVDDVQGNGGTTSGGWSFVDAPVHKGAKSRRQSGDGLVQHFFHDAPRRVVLSADERFYVWVRLDPDDPPRTLMMQLHSAGSWEHRMYWGEDAISFGGIGQDTPGHRRGGDLPAAGEWVRLEVDPGRVGLPPGTAVDGMAFTQMDGTAHWDQAGVATRVPALALDGPPPELMELLASAWGRSASQDHEVAVWYGTIAPELGVQRSELEATERGLAELEASLPLIPVTMATTPRTMRVLARGNWMDDSGEVVLPGTPGFLPAPSPAEDGGTRLELARWLVSPRNPLTARVVVNRYWRLLFGQGLARDVDDLGSQGAWPSNLALLDALALDFVQSGWDVRALLRRLVHTEAYRRASNAEASHLAADPSGQLFGRQGRWRLDAEFVRDGALAASGLLAREVGGPSVKPYQPAGYWAQLNFPVRTWKHDAGAAQYRRGLYTFWCRTFLHPSLRAFDAPAREESCARRAQSNTPLQALVLLNDPTFAEAARVLAQRVLGEEHSKDGARLTRATQLVLQRDPSPAEAQVLIRVLSEHRARYRGDPTAAAALAGVGMQPTAEDLDLVELAAWTGLARVLLNLGEAITRR